MKPVVKFNNVSKTYSLFKKKSDQLLDIFSFGEDNKGFSALSNISFEVFKGETIGIIGINGSGKSTLSNILAQVVPPSSGTIDVYGETSLVAISAGLNNQLSGLENIELKCLMHGMKKSEIFEIIPDIIEFADIGEFISQPIKNYSSGMKSRLGFAISVHIDPDILVVDEALSVGDSTFYQKCLNKFDEFQAQGKTIFFISHSLSQVKSISDRIIWLNFGQIARFDSTEVVEKEYNEFINWFNKLTEEKKKAYRKKMLSTQIGKMKKSELNIEPDGQPSRMKKEQKRKDIFESLQMILISGIFILSTLLMFFENPIESLIKIEGNIDIIEDTPRELIDSDEDEEQGEITQEKVNKTGLISLKSTSVYSDKELKGKLGDLYFSTEVHVEEKIGESIYKVKAQEISGYIDSSGIKVLEDEIPITDLIIVDFLPLFPEPFASSYTFFLSYLNTEYDVVKNSLQGLTSENKDQFEQKQLVYEREKISYKFNEDNISSAIKIEKVNMESLMVQEVVRQSILASQNEQLYFLVIDNYRVYLDVINETIMFQLTEETPR